MHQKPEFIQAFERPAGTEIKFINGHYYPYERKSAYDPGTKRKKKKSGALLGTITEYGFVPRKEKVSQQELKEIQCVEYGACNYLYQSNRQMIGRLKRYFPNTWKTIFTLASLKCLRGDLPQAGTGGLRDKLSFGLVSPIEFIFGIPHGNHEGARQKSQ